MFVIHAWEHHVTTTAHFFVFMTRAVSSFRSVPLYGHHSNEAFLGISHIKITSGTISYGQTLVWTVKSLFTTIDISSGMFSRISGWRISGFFPVNGWWTIPLTWSRWRCENTTASTLLRSIQSCFALCTYTSVHQVSNRTAPSSVCIWTDNHHSARHHFLAPLEILFSQRIVIFICSCKW